MVLPLEMSDELMGNVLLVQKIMNVMSVRHRAKINKQDDQMNTEIFLSQRLDCTMWKGIKQLQISWDTTEYKLEIGTDVQNNCSISEKKLKQHDCNNFSISEMNTCQRNDMESIFPSVLMVKLWQTRRFLMKRRLICWLARFFGHVGFMENHRFPWGFVQSLVPF